MSDNKPVIVIDGDVSPFRQKLREAASELKRFGDNGGSAFERMTGPLAVLQSKFIAVAALLGGGQVFQAAVQESQKLTGEANSLSRALGISTTEAGALNIALGDIYSSSEDFIGAAQQLGRQLRTNEDDLNAMGLRTRDANGEYRNMKELMLDAIKVLAGYKEGTDRTLAAQTMFGRGAAETTKLLKLNNEVIEEARQKQEALGLQIGVHNVEDAKAYKASMNDVGDVLSAFKKAIGDAVMPVLTELGNWFSSIGPAAVTVIKGAIGGLVALFWGLRLSILSIIQIQQAVRDTVFEPWKAWASAMSKIVQGDFSGAVDRIKEIPGNIGTAWSQSFGEITRNAEVTRDKLWNLFANPDDTGPKAANGKRYVAPPGSPDKTDTKKKADPSFMNYYELALSEEKRLASEKNALREYTKQEELAFWELLLQKANLTTKDRVAIEKKAADLTVAIRRQEAKEIQDLSAEAIAHNQALAIGRVDAEAAAAEAAVANSQITKLQMAELEVQFEQKRLEIQRAALQERLALAEQDPNSSPVEKMRIQNQIEQLEQQHGTRMIQLQTKVAQESAQIWDDLGQRMSSLWDKGVQALMNGTFRWRNAFKAVGLELVSWFANSVVGEQVKVFLAGQAKQLAMKMGFLAQEKTAQTVASAQVIATKSSEATSVATANAVEAGSGAAASQASIPFAGPVLALAAMAAIFAAVMSMGGKVKSASRGFAIPKGMNPMTQLHEEEMVLPANLSKGIGKLIDEGVTASGNNISVSYNIKALDGHDVKRVLMKNSDGLAAAIKEAVRKFQL